MSYELIHLGTFNGSKNAPHNLDATVCTNEKFICINNLECDEIRFIGPPNTRTGTNIRIYKIINGTIIDYLINNYDKITSVNISNITIKKYLIEIIEMMNLDYLSFHKCIFENDITHINKFIPRMIFSYCNTELFESTLNKVEYDLSFSGIHIPNIIHKLVNMYSYEKSEIILN